MPNIPVAIYPVLQAIASGYGNTAPSQFRASVVRSACNWCNRRWCAQAAFPRRAWER